MTWSPKYNLYQVNGTSLVYAFDYVLSDNSPQDPIKYVEFENLRATGSLITGGGKSAWDLSLRFFLKKTDYATLIVAMDSMESTIVMNTPYVLKIDRTISTTKTYNVKRVLPVQWDDTQRVKFQKGIITFRANAW